MAIAAADGQRRRKQPHRAHEFVDWDPFQDLHVLEDLIGHLNSRRGLADHKRHARQPYDESERDRKRRSSVSG
jgi:hypothetical protein